MQIEEYERHLAALKHGKRLPTAVYVFREADTDFGRELNQLLAILAMQHDLDEKFNVIKFRTDELKVSFLCYPDFLEEAHPALRHAVTIDLVTGQARHTDYADNHNPPILHRKETFLSEHQPDHSVFEVSYGIGRISSWCLSGQPLFEVHDDSLSCSLKVGLEFSNLKIGPSRFFSGHFL